MSQTLIKAGRYPNLRRQISQSTDQFFYRKTNGSWFNTFESPLRWILKPTRVWKFVLHPFVTKSWSSIKKTDLKVEYPFFYDELCKNYTLCDSLKELNLRWRRWIRNVPFNIYRHRIFIFILRKIYHASQFFSNTYCYDQLCFNNPLQNLYPF